VTSGRPFATGGAPLSKPTRQRATATAWERFIAGEDVSQGVRPEILLSWYRCRDDFKVDPHQERAPSAPDDQPAHSLEDDVVAAELGGVAKSIEPDAEALDGLVAVTDGQGRILAAWGSRQALNGACERNLGPRCTWSEEMTGTNGMGTALLSGDPVSVQGPEHWCAGFHDWGCAGIAIRDPVTNLPLGVLDVSSRKKPLPDAVLNWLRRAGQRVEAGLRDQALRSFCDLVTVFREQERGARGVLAAADKGGRLVLANEEAQRLFGTGRPDPPRELVAELPHLKEVMVKAVERARRDRLWTGVARLYVPTAGSDVAVAFRPAVRQERVVGVLLTTAEDGGDLDGDGDGEPLTAAENAPVSARNQGRLVGLHANRMILLSVEQVRFAEADGNDVWLETADRRLRASGRGLGALEERLQGQGFLRVHRQFLVNLRWVKEIVPSFKGGFWLVIDGPGNPLIPVSRRQVAEVRRMLGLTWQWSEKSTSRPGA
jgi:hypothetical protein